MVSDWFKGFDVSDAKSKMVTHVGQDNTDCVTRACTSMLAKICKMMR